VTTGYLYQNCQITVKLSVSLTERNTKTSYTNQKTLRSFAGNTGLLTSTRDQIYIRDTSQYQCEILTYNAIPAYTTLSISCKTHSKAVSLKYTIEHTNIDTLKITQYKHET